jgi:hypothetical protein
LTTPIIQFGPLEPKQAVELFYLFIFLESQ